MLKVALADAPYARLAAVATVAGVYAFDLKTAAPVAGAAPDGEPGMKGGMLCCGGKGGMLCCVVCERLLLPLLQPLAKTNPHKTQPQQPQQQPTAPEQLEAGRVLTAAMLSDLTTRQCNDVRWGAHDGRAALFAACSDRPRVDALYLGP